jgi:hypothetical protein
MRRLLFVLATLTCVVPEALTAQRQLTLLITVANDDGTELSGLTPWRKGRITTRGRKARM